MSPFAPRKAFACLKIATSVEKGKRDLPGKIRFVRLAFGTFGFSGGYGVFSLFYRKKAQDILSGIRLRSLCV